MTPDPHGYVRPDDDPPFSADPRPLREAVRAVGAAMWDDPTLDGTDGAHPAWWRGCDHGVAAERARHAALVEALERERKVWWKHTGDWSDEEVGSVIDRLAAALDGETP